MYKPFSFAVAAAVLSLSAVLSVATADETTETPAEAAETPSAPEISDTFDTGIVVLNGKYLPPPYRLEVRDDKVFVNDNPVTLFREITPRGEGPFSGRQRGWPGQGMPDGAAAPGGAVQPGGATPDATAFPARRGFGPWQGSGPRQGAWAWRPIHGQLRFALEEDRMTLLWDGRPPVMLDNFGTLCFLEVIFSDASPEDKLAAAQEAQIFALGNEDIQLVLDEFEPTAELRARMEEPVRLYRARVDEADANHQRVLAIPFFRSKTVRYGMTVAAMGLAVVAFGNLLRRPPEKGRAWREQASESGAAGVVVRNVALLAVLGCFDLAATLTAEGAGGFMELNPFGDTVAMNPIALSVVKLTSLAVSCSLLFSLRRYQGALVASWWLCLLCTVLTFRWATYNSLFLT